MLTALSDGSGLEVQRCCSIAPTKKRFGGIVQQGFSIEHVGARNKHMAVVLSGVVAASTQLVKVNALIPIPKMGRRKMTVATSGAVHWCELRVPVCAPGSPLDGWVRPPVMVTLTFMR
jgi:hypothetical protein